MRIIEEIAAKLQKYPHVKYEGGGDFINVLPTSDHGFTVGLVARQGSYTVSFNGWHEDYEDEEEALNCFGFGLSSECRLKEDRRGGIVYKWTVQSKANGKWIEDSTTGLLLFPFWMKKETRYLQNDLIGMVSETDNPRPDSTH